MSPSLRAVGILPCLLSALVAASPVPNPQPSTDSIIFEGDVVIENPTFIEGDNVINYGDDHITIRTTVTIYTDEPSGFSILPWWPIATGPPSYSATETGGPHPPHPTGPPSYPIGPGTPKYPNATYSHGHGSAPSSGLLTGSSVGTSYPSSWGTGYSSETAYSSGTAHSSGTAYSSGTAPLGTAGTSGFPAPSDPLSPLWPNVTTVTGPVTITPSGSVSTGTAPLGTGTAPLTTLSTSATISAAPSGTAYSSPSGGAVNSTVVSPTIIIPPITAAPTHTPLGPPSSAAEALSELKDFIESWLESWFPGYASEVDSDLSGVPTGLV